MEARKPDYSIDFNKMGAMAVSNFPTSDLQQTCARIVFHTELEARLALFLEKAKAVGYKKNIHRNTS